jgi:tetratricopeptide (TPR) repeat protein
VQSKLVSASIVACTTGCRQPNTIGKPGCQLPLFLQPIKITSILPVDVPHIYNLQLAIRIFLDRLIKFIYPSICLHRAVQPQIQIGRIKMSQTSPKSSIELEIAEAEYKRKLETEEKAGNKEGMVKAYGNLGTIYLTMDLLDKAEEMFKKSLEIEEKLANKEGMASDYGYLGTIYQIRKNLEQAENMFKKNLKINQKLGRNQGMATAYGKLGEIYYASRDMDQAEDMFKKGLKMEEKLDNEQAMATAYGFLGDICRIRQDLDQAEDLYKESLKLFLAIGSDRMIQIMKELLTNLKKKKEQGL